MVNSLLRQAKYNYYNDKIVSAACDVMKFWSMGNDISGHPMVKDAFPLEACPEVGVAAPKIKKVSDLFNSFFSTVGINLSTAIRSSGPEGVVDKQFCY